MVGTSHCRGAEWVTFSLKTEAKSVESQSFIKVGLERFEMIYWRES